MTDRRRPVIAIVTVAAMLACLIPSALLAIQHRALVGLFPPDFGASFVFAVVGAFLLVRGANLRISLIMCVQGVTTGLTTICGVIREVAALDGPLHGVPLWAAWLDNFVWIPGVALLTPLVLLFPDGRLDHRRWRWLIAAVGTVAGIFTVGGIVLKMGLEDGKPYAFAPNPTGLFPSGPVLDVVGTVGFVVFVVSIFVSLGSLVTRRRRAVGVARAQLSCLLFGTSVLAVLLALVNFAPHTNLLIGAAFLVITPLPVSVAVAVLRYKLFAIDKVVSRTLAYALVVAVLAGVYVGVLATLAALVPAHYGKVGVAVATLVVSVVALPLTRRVRRAVDHRFDRRRFDAERVADAFALRLRARPERGDVPADLLAVVHRTVAPAHANVWLVQR